MNIVKRLSSVVLALAGGLISAHAAEVISPDFSYLPVTGETATGWFTGTMSEGIGTTRMVGPEGKDVFIVHDGHHPHKGFTIPTNFTFSTIINVDMVNPTLDEWAVVWSLGSTETRKLGMMLTKHDGKLYLQQTYRSSTEGFQFKPEADDPRDGHDSSVDYACCESPVLTPGYHLVTAVVDVDNNLLKLKIDGAETIVSSSHGSKVEAVKGGLQLGNAYGGRPSPLIKGDGTAFARLQGWSSALDEDALTALWESFRAEIANPFSPTYTPDSQNGAAIYLPSLTLEGRPLQATWGTMTVPATSTVSAPAICCGNSDIKRAYTLNVEGRVNITEASTGYNVYDERFNRGILFGHWAGTGTVNVSGTLNAPDAYLQTIYDSFKSVAVNINGGTVAVRGLYAANGGSKISISNGGTLAFADFHAGSAIPVTVGKGTIRGVSYGESTGWTHVGALNLTDAENGATIDANGLDLVFSGVVTGAGKLTVADSSETKAGVVRFKSLAAHTGYIVVTGGAIDIGTARPKTTIDFAEGTALVLTETVADSDNRVALAFTGTPSVTMYRADGTTQIDATKISIETDADTGLNYISYPTTATPVVSGEACWYDFEFDGRNKTSTGRDKKKLERDTEHGIGEVTGRGSAGDYKDEYSLYTASQLYMSPVYPVEWSAAVYASVPEYNHAVLMAFGTRDVGLIGLAAGDVAKNEVLLVRTTGNKAFETLATMTVPNAYTAQHLYVFTKSERMINVYLDGTLWTTYTSETPITFGNGFQIGSVYGNQGNTGLVRFATTLFTDGADNPIIQNSSIGMLRLYDSLISNQAIQTLATEFPYVSPNGLYQRTLTGDANWTEANAWTKAVEGGEGEPADEPANGAAVQVTATVDSTLTIGEDGVPRTITLESLTIGGTGAMTLVAAEGTQIVNTGKTVINTSVTIPHTVSVSGGPMSVSPTATVIFDYSGYDLALGAPNGALTLTGIAGASDKVQIIPPTNTKGRTFNLVYNTAIQSWQLQYARGAYTLQWKDTATETWDETTVWTDRTNGGEAAFLAGDSAVFGDLAGVTSTSIATPEIAVGSLMFTNEVEGSETDYVLTGGALSAVAGIRDVGQGAAIVSNRIDLADNAPLYVQGVVKPQEFLDVRGTAGEVRITTGASAEERGNLTLGTAGTLNLAGTTIVNPDTDLTLTGSGTINQTSGLYVDASATVRKTGSGTYVKSLDQADGWYFNGRLEVSEGRFEIRSKFNTAIATEENPIKVNGTGRLTVVSVDDTRNRLPDGAYVLVEDEGVFEVEGNNPFKRESNASPTVVCRNGGTFRSNGASVAYDVHVWDVRLEDGSLRLAGTAENWGKQGVVIDCKTLTSGGASRLYCDAGCPNRLVVDTLDVTNGVLTCELKTSKDLVKTGAGAITFAGTGGAYTRKVVINGGTVIPSEALVAKTDAISFAAGTGFDLSDATEPFEAGNLAMTGDITLFVGDRELANNTKLIGWTTEPAAETKFRLSATGGKSHYGLARKQDGVYVQLGFSITIR